jgi:hypothetical protein
MEVLNDVTASDQPEAYLLPGLEQRHLAGANLRESIAVPDRRFAMQLAAHPVG